MEIWLKGGENMNQRLKIYLLILAALLTLSSLVSVPTLVAQDPNLASANQGLNYLRNSQQENGSITGFTGISHWATIAFASAGIKANDVELEDGESLLRYIRSNPPGSSSPATDWERAMLSLYATGKRARSYWGVRYLDNLEAKYNSNQIGDPSLVNDDIFGLLALIAAGSRADGEIKSNVLNFILAHQNPDGGFSWSTSFGSDSNDTAAAIQALIAARNSGLGSSGVNSAIEKAKDYLLTTQNPDGGFVYEIGSDSDTASSSWAVLALSSLGLGNSAESEAAESYIRNRQLPDGSFEWMSGFGGDTFTTSYAVTALSGKYWPIRFK